MKLPNKQRSFSRSGNPLGWSEFETLNRDSSGGTGDAEEGALFPLNLEGSCDTYKKATVSAGETLRDNVCYEVKSEGFLDTFSSNLNADAGKDHSCLYDIKVG